MNLGCKRQGAQQGQRDATVDQRWTIGEVTRTLTAASSFCLASSASTESGVFLVDADMLLLRYESSGGYVHGGERGESINPALVEARAS